jgi:hypothetical protein
LSFKKTLCQNTVVPLRLYRKIYIYNFLNNIIFLF